MSLHDFDELFSHYSEVIADMDEVFTAHQFFLRLAQRNQRAYIEALNAYRNSLAPFQQVHQRLADMLNNTRECERCGEEQDSLDIWRSPQSCSRWRKTPSAVPASETPVRMG
jgi:hypothetical protein